jgi:hypothetical protein
VADDQDDSRPDHGIATLQEPRGTGGARRERRWRRIGLVVMALVVAAALSGVLGSRGGTAVVSEGPVTMTVEYAQITRPGVEAELQIHLRHDDGFTGPVTIAIDRDLFGRLDFNSWYPTAASETSNSSVVIYEFDPPAGQEFTVRLDAHAQSTQWPSADTYTVALMDEEHDVEAEFRMWVLP